MSNVLWSAIFLVMGLILYLAFFNSFIIAAVVGAAFAVLGGGMLYHFHKIKTNPATNLFGIINQNPTKIIWVYTLETNLMPFGFKVQDKGLIYFKMIDGEEISVKLRAKDLKLVSRFLNRLLPDAMFGFSEEKQTRYNEQCAMNSR